MTDTPDDGDKNLEKFLKTCGYDNSAIDLLSKDSELFRDMGLYGDSAAETLTVLESKFSVDLSQLRFELYFPSELSVDALAFNFCKFLSFRKGISRISRRYIPVNLSQIDMSINKKQWLA